MFKFMKAANARTQGTKKIKQKMTDKAFSSKKYRLKLSPLKNV